jgi:hypothetical protein
MGTVTGEIMCGQFEILGKLRTITVARMLMVLSDDKVRRIRQAMTAEQRASVAARLREGGFNQAAQVVLA